MDAQLRPDHGPVRSAKREVVVVQKNQPDKKGVGGWVPSQLISISCSITHARASFPLHNPQPPMRGFASLTGNTLAVRNVINGLDHASIFICK